MGLSDEERIYGMYWGINKLVYFSDQLHEQRDVYRYKKLFTFTDQLWHAFIGNHHNSAHWILGSSAGNDISHDTLTPWGVAINGHTRDIVKEEGIIKGDWHKSDIFDAFDGFLDIPGLLGSQDHADSVLYELYAYTEDVVYRLRRYQDELLSKLKELDMLISNIQGECFNLFKDNETFARAYILNQILKPLYGPQYPYAVEKLGDVVTKWLEQENIHHDLNRVMNPREMKLEDLAQIHIKIYKAQKAGKLTMYLRAETALVLCGHRFSADYAWNKMVQIFKTDKTWTKADKGKLCLVFKANQEALKKQEEKNKKMQDRDHPSNLSIYGTTFAYDK